MGYDLRKPGGHLGNVGLIGHIDKGPTIRYGGVRASKMRRKGHPVPYVTNSWTKRTPPPPRYEARGVNRYGGLLSVTCDTELEAARHFKAMGGTEMRLESLQRSPDLSGGKIPGKWR